MKKSFLAWICVLTLLFAVCGYAVVRGDGGASVADAEEARGNRHVIVPQATEKPRETVRREMPRATAAPKAATTDASKDVPTAAPKAATTDASNDTSTAAPKAATNDASKDASTAAPKVATTTAPKDVTTDATKDAPTAEPTVTPQPTPVGARPVLGPVPTADNSLKRGSSGAEVKEIQTKLRELGFMTGSADGIFGKVTESAVVALRAYMHEVSLFETRGEGLPEVDLSTETPAPAATGNATQNGSDKPAATGDATQNGDDKPAATGNATQNGSDKPAATGNATQNEDDKPTATGADTQNGSDAPEDALPDEDAAPVSVVDGEEETPEFLGIVDDEIRILLLAEGFEVYRAEQTRGCEGLEVTRLQTRLNTLNFLYGGIDGQYGGKTESAVRAFQERNDLPETGIADEQTQRLLYSGDALKAKIPALPYLLKVSVSDQKVYAYAYDVSTGGYTKLTRSMTCSTGLVDTPTPYGTFAAGGPVARWGYFPKWDVYAQYLYRIRGGILFHSVLYKTSDESSLITGSVSKLGSRASHGCIRLSVADAKWIYNNCPAGTNVTVY